MDRIELTEELKDELNGLMPFSSDARFEYTPRAYLGKNIQKPVFKLRTFTVNEKMDALDAMRPMVAAFVREKEHESKIDKKIIDSVRKIIVGWSGLFYLDTGKEIEFKKGEDGYLDAEVVSLLPIGIILDIFGYISSKSCIFDAEKLGLGL